MSLRLSERLYAQFYYSIGHGISQVINRKKERNRTERDGEALKREENLPKSVQTSVKMQINVCQLRFCRDIIHEVNFFGGSLCL